MKFWYETVVTTQDDLISYIDSNSHKNLFE